MPARAQSRKLGPSYRTQPVARDRAPLPDRLSHDSTLADLVVSSETSVRLHNCIQLDTDLGQLTIRQYLAEPEASFAYSLKTPHLGKKTAIELRELVHAFARDSIYDVDPTPRPLSQACDEATATLQPKDVILAILRQFEFPTALLQLDISVRLSNVLKDVAERQRAGLGPAVPFLTIADVVRRWDEATSFLLKFKNFGRKSLKELKCVIEDLLRRRLVKLIPADLLPDTLTIEGVAHEFVPKFTESLIGVYPSLSDEIVNPNDPQFVFDSVTDAREQIADIIGGLSKKERDVLFRRFGLQGYRIKTLEEIGNEFYVTRERVRQVEAKAVKRLQIGPRMAAFKRLLDLEAKTLWNTLSIGSELLLPEDLEQRHRDIDPVLQLAITVVYGNLDKWVSDFGTPLGPGWIRTDTDRPLEAIRLLIAAVGDYSRNMPLPRSVAGITEDLDVGIEDVALAARASGRFRVFEDYVIDGPVGPQARRTVRFHKVFLEHQDEDLLDFTIPRAAYRTRYPEDDGGSRVFDLQMRRAPHLFASIFDSIWLPLPDQGVAFCRRGVIRYNTAGWAPDREFDDDTIIKWLARKLRELGPTRSVDLRGGATVEFGPTTPASSIQATLVMEPTFIRLAPGVFGLQEHVAALSAERAVFPDAFFSPPHCRYYIMARKAGEPMDLYPGWNFGFEAQLCRWSKLHHPNDLYRSLLNVAAPENWPVSDQERTAWMHTKSIYGRYEFDAVSTSIREANSPDESHILAALAVLGTLGGLSWISVNRTAHRRLDSGHAVAGLALLVALNAIKPTQQWQERHLPEADHSAVFARMASERSRTGVPRWNKGNLRSLLEEALVRLPERDLGWLDQNEARTVIERLLRSPTTKAPTFERIEPDEILGSDWSAPFNANRPN